MESCFADTYRTTAGVVRAAAGAAVCAIHVYSDRKSGTPAFYPSGVEKSLPTPLTEIERTLGYSLTARLHTQPRPASDGVEKGSIIGGTFVLPIFCEEVLFGHLLLGDAALPDVADIPLTEFAGHHLKTVMAMEREISALHTQTATHEMRERETHHRMKNSLQTVTSLLSLQAQDSNNMSLSAYLHEAVSRIRAIELLHERLAVTDDHDNLSPLAYFSSLVAAIIETFDPDPPVELNVTVDDRTIPASTLGTLGMVANELMTNTLFYAFEGVRRPELHLQLRNRSDHLVLVIRDNGIGLPDGFDSRSSASTGLGTTIVRFLVERLDGTVEYHSDDGTIVTITVPL